MNVANLPIFVPDSPSVILQRLKTNYEAEVNKTLLPAQSESILIQAFVYEIKILIDQFNEGARKQLVEFSEGPMLDYIVAFLGLTRLPASNAADRITFNLVAGHAAVTIPSGIRVQSNDGKAVFRTVISTSIPSEIGSPGLYPSATVDVECITPGIVGNGYTAGLISNILDPLPFVTSAANIGTSAGGSDMETDDQLRERFYLAPGQFSTAGAVEAYKFWARTASASIIDVAVTRPVAGTVEVFPLIAGGIATPSLILNAVFDALDEDKRRPLSDTVLTTSPTKISYVVDVELTMLNSGDDTLALSAATDALNAYIENRKVKLGLDVVVSQIIAVCKNADPYIYDVVVNDPSANVSVAANEYASPTSVTIAITAHTNG